MKNKKTAFPEGFLWGACTSAYQFEGAATTHGKGKSIQDVKEGSVGDFEVGMDHYHKYKEDIKLLANMGLKAYRFSIAWSRILPDGIGKVNQEGLQFYQNIINECRDYGIVPIVSMYHDDLPYALEKKGGWGNRETIEAFVSYAGILFDAFHDDVLYWNPIAEQNVYMIEDIVHKKYSLQEVFQRNHHRFLAHAKVTNLYRQKNGRGQIGIFPNIIHVYAHTTSPVDQEAAMQMDTIRNIMFLDVGVKGEYPKYALHILDKLNALPIFEDGDLSILKQGTCDYISFSNYTSICVKKSMSSDVIDHTNMKYGFQLPYCFEVVRNEHLGYTQFESEVDPISVRLTLHNLQTRYNLPLLIVQRGYVGNEVVHNGTVEDDNRIAYIKLQIKEVKQAIEEGVQIIGYCTWSAFDVMSTSSGIDKRYGLIYIDRENDDIKELKRIPKKSYFWFKEVIKRNGEGI